jgi:hypothetical protein
VSTSSEAFSASVKRPTTSWTRASSGRSAFRYATLPAVAEVGASEAGAAGGRKATRALRARWYEAGLSRPDPAWIVRRSQVDPTWERCQRTEVRVQATPSSSRRARGETFPIERSAWKLVRDARGDSSGRLDAVQRFPGGRFGIASAWFSISSVSPGQRRALGSRCGSISDEVGLAYRPAFRCESSRVSWALREGESGSCF